MQGVFQAIFSHGNVLKYSVLRHVRVVAPVVRPAVFSRSESVTATKLEEHGFESTTIADVLNAKGKGADGSWLWCSTDDSVYDAVQSMTSHNVGALVVLRPGEDKAIAGIITERGGNTNDIVPPSPQFMEIYGIIDLEGSADQSQRFLVHWKNQHLSKDIWMNKEDLETLAPNFFVEYMQTNFSEKSTLRSRGVNVAQNQKINQGPMKKSKSKLQILANQTKDVLRDERS